MPFSRTPYIVPLISGNLRGLPRSPFGVRQTSPHSFALPTIRPYPSIPMADNNPSHGELLSHSLQQLQLQTEAAAHAAEERGRSEDMPGKEAHFASSPSSALPNRLDRMASSSLIREGYGFRPTSGISTPALNEAFTEGERGSPLPDPNGLGWPGA